MAAVTVRNIPADTHAALKERAARNGRSTEAEIRSILEGAVHPKEGMGSALAAIGRRLRGGVSPVPRDGTPVEPADFG